MSFEKGNKYKYNKNFIKYYEYLFQKIINKDVSISYHFFVAILSL